MAKKRKRKGIAPRGTTQGISAASLSERARALLGTDEAPPDTLRSLAEEIDQRLSSALDVRASSYDEAYAKWKKILRHKPYPSLVRTRDSVFARLIAIEIAQAQTARCAKDPDLAVEYLRKALRDSEARYRLSLYFHCDGTRYSDYPLRVPQDAELEKQELLEHVVELETAKLQDALQGKDALKRDRALRSALASCVAAERINLSGENIGSEQLVAALAGRITCLLRKSRLWQSPPRQLTKVVKELLRAVLYGLAANGLYEFIRTLHWPSGQAQAYRQIQEDTLSRARRRFFRRVGSFPPAARQSCDAMLSSLTECLMTLFDDLGLGYQLLDAWYEECLALLKKARASGSDVTFEVLFLEDIAAFLSRPGWVAEEDRTWSCPGVMFPRTLVHWTVHDYAMEFQRVGNTLLLLREGLLHPAQRSRIYGEYDEEETERQALKHTRVHLPGLLKRLRAARSAKTQEALISQLEDLTYESLPFENAVSPADRKASARRIARDLKDKYLQDSQPR